ncbi:MAG TPA: EAL domain-containing protein [Streptosporangiaceae bacterium]|jgi:diguanylate cyclase (GGDEF)-like protein
MRVPRATAAIVAVSVAGGVLSLLAAAARQQGLAQVTSGQWMVAAAVGALALGSWMWPVVVYRGGESAAFHMDEGFFVVLALLEPPLITLGTLALATVVAQAARRRPLVKSAFNAGQVLTAAGLGLAVSRGIAAPAGSPTAGQAGAVLAGVAVYVVINTLLVGCVVVSMGTRWHDFISDLRGQLTHAGAGALVGVVLALAIQAHLWVLALAIPGLVVERRLISARFAALYDRARMEGLYEVTLAANRGLREQAVLDTILGSVRRLLRSPEANLASDVPGQGELAAPMTVGSQQRWLVASGRRRDEPFDEADLSLLRALAAVGSGALSNAELFQQVRLERERLSSITVELHQRACYDSLTGLANRRLLVERLDLALRRSALDRKTHALIFLDLDRFKSINDSLGHVTGDEFLVAVGARMKAVVRSDDLLARFGGDEFVVLLEDVAGVEEALAAARRICVAIQQPMVLPDGYELVASVSVGIALTEPGKAADDVLRNADVAMYDAKVKGGGGTCRVFDKASMGSRSSARLQIEADLRKGLERDELEVHYQPFYSLAERRIVGAEALVRWRHPTNGLIRPMRFIPMAEETGLILPLAQCVLDKACRQVRSIRDRLGVDLPISVNLSPRQFQENGFLAQVTRALDAIGLPSELLIFEITESMVMEDPAGAGEIMRKLSRLGVRLAIDDFGTGHSSLAYLKQFPVHEVKVDRVFVQGVAESQVDSAIVRAIIDLANAMGIAAVAEGVETEHQVAGLRVLGCEVAQGFYFSQPLCAGEFDDLLTRHFTQVAAPAS